MKLDTTKVLTDLAGEPLKFTDGKEEINVGAALGNILMHPRPKKPNENVNTVRLYVLAKKLYQEKEVTLKPEDLKLLRDYCETDTRFGPIVNGQLLEILG